MIYKMSFKSDKNEYEYVCSQYSEEVWMENAKDRKNPPISMGVNFKTTISAQFKPKEKNEEVNKLWNDFLNTKKYISGKKTKIFKDEQKNLMEEDGVGTELDISNCYVNFIEETGSASSYKLNVSMKEYKNENKNNKKTKNNTTAAKNK